MAANKSSVDFSIDFKGRIRRKTYWITYLTYLAIAVGFSLISTIILVVAAIPGRFALAICSVIVGMVWVVFSIWSVLMCLSLIIRRLHDMGYSGWLLLIWNLLYQPIYWLLYANNEGAAHITSFVASVIVILFMCQDSEKGTNKWGPSPKYGEPEATKEGAVDNLPSSHQDATAPEDELGHYEVPIPTTNKLTTDNQKLVNLSDNIVADNPKSDDEK